MLPREVIRMTSTCSFTDSFPICGRSTKVTTDEILDGSTSRDCHGHSNRQNDESEPVSVSVNIIMVTTTIVENKESPRSNKR